MTPRALTYQALDFLGADYNTITLAGARKLARIASDMTTALQIISREAPTLLKTRRGQRAIAAETVSVTCTNNSVDVTVSATFVDRSTIRIEGDDAWNEIYIGASSQKKLLIPYGGTTGVHTATLYHDVLELDSDAGELLGYPIVEGFGMLAKATNRQDLLDFPRESRDYGRRIRPSTAANRLTGRPTRFWCEPYYNYAHAQKTLIRLYPIPTAAVQLSYDVRLTARTVTSSDLGTDASDSTFVLPLQEGYHASLLRPLFLKEWTGSTWFKNEEAKKKIEADAAVAMRLLATFKPQKARNRSLTAPL